jgi:hypothetical protein
VPIETTVLSGAQAGTSAYRIDRDPLRAEGPPPRARRDARPAGGRRRGAPTAGREALWKLGLDTIDGDAAGDVAVTATDARAAAPPGIARGVVATCRRRLRLPRHGRRLDPYGLLLRTGFWYVVGRDHDPRRAADVPRRPHRGRRRVSTDETFERPAGYDLRTRSRSTPRSSARRRPMPSPSCASTPPGPAASCASSGRAGRRRHADGAVDVEVPCANVPAFRSWVLGLLDHAEVLSPPDVRADGRRLADAMVAPMSDRWRRDRRGAAAAGCS